MRAIRWAAAALTAAAVAGLTLGPATTNLYDATAPFLWSLIAGPDGSMYVGSGNDGQLYRIDPTGRASVFFDAEELEIHALALALARRAPMP